jgi:hypothetical protein
MIMTHQKRAGNANPYLATAALILLASKGRLWAA